MARTDSRVARVDFKIFDQPAEMAAALEQLPIAVGLVDSFGRYVARSGALQALMGDVIPSRSSRLASRWTINDDHGAAMNPAHWPAARALRGETVLPGQAATHQGAPGDPHRALRVIAAPLSDPDNVAKAVVLIQDTDPDWRARRPMSDHLELRFAETLVGAIQAATRQYDALAPVKAEDNALREAGLPAVGNMPAANDLTHREDQVLKLLAWGFSQKEVGLRLGVSVKTVDFHRIRAMGKLNLQTRVDLVRHAARQDWFREELI
jgi:DNA-binding NarL/FixJ family response regulator